MTAPELDDILNERMDKTMNETFGQRFARLRKQRGLTQEELGEKLNISGQAVSKWESGKSDPSTTNLMALAKLFGLSPEDLLREVRSE